MKVDKLSVANISMFLFSYCLYLIYCSIDLRNLTISRSGLIFTSWVGIFVFFYIVYTYYIKFKKFFTLYTIFVILSFVFNFGQCFFWALGVQYEGGISEGIVYNKIAISNVDIMNAQIYFIVCVLAVHAGYMIFSKDIKENNLVEDIGRNEKKNRLIYKISLIASFVVIPITFIVLFYQLFIVWKYGYYALYYGENISSGVPFEILQHSFFTCLIGVLVGSKFKRKTLVAVYLIFAIYLVLGVMKGDRGDWFYKLLILIWIYHTYVRKFDYKKIFKAFILASISLYLIQAIVSIRNEGISFASVLNALMLQTQNPIIDGIFELGDSMKVNIVVWNNNIEYPYGNTYLLSLLAMVTMRIPQALGIAYEPLSGWFSDTYLGLNYGAAFTMYAEALINYGIYCAPLFFVFIGILSSKVLNVGRECLKRNPIQLFFSVSTSAFLFNMIRNTAHDFLKYWFLGCIPVVSIVYFLSAKRGKGNG